MKTDRRGSGPPSERVRSTWRTRLPFFYGWVVLGSVFLTQALVYGAYYSFSVFFVALLQEFGWSRAPTAAVFSIFVLVAGLVGVVTGTLVDRFGPGRTVPVGAALLALGLVATSRVSELWQFYLLFGVVSAVGMSLSGWVPCVAVVSRWFSARRGTAIGIASAGIGMALVLLVPLCQFTISHLGWRTAYLALGGLILLGVAPQVMLLQVGHPGQLGLRPDGAPPDGADPKPERAVRREQRIVDPAWASRPWSVGDAVRTVRFWLLAVNAMLSQLTIQMLWVHQVAYLVDGGHDKMFAASVAGLAGLASIPCKISWGMVSDRLGREITFSLATSMMLISIGLLVLVPKVPGPTLPLLFAVVYAAGYGVTGPVSPAAAADIFASRSFGGIYGAIAVISGMGSAIGAWLAGFVFDITGSYLVAFGVAAASFAASALCLWLAAPRKVRRVRALA